MNHRCAYRPLIAWFACALGMFPAQATRADTFVFADSRAGAYPPYDGQGWIGEVYLDIPDDFAIHLVAAEIYIDGRTPDLTFRTDWIDFPAGPTAVLPDADILTLGDLLNDYIYDVSDPTVLDTPFCNLLIRFRGYLKVALEHGTQSIPGLPVWVDFGSIGYDGYRTLTGMTIYRSPRVNPLNPFFTENGIFFALGLFPIEVSFYNRLDPDNEFGYDRAGLEFYSWHGGGLALPGGQLMVHPTRGPATLVPPWLIYQAEDIRPLLPGDFEGDADVDLADWSWFESCFTGPQGEMSILNCETFDADTDFDVDLLDVATIQRNFTG